MMALPIFQLGSNIWTGAWNMFSGIVTVLLCCFGEISMKKSQGLLLISVIVTVVNIINLIILEVRKNFLQVKNMLLKCMN
jgi:hypothetical protein